MRFGRVVRRVWALFWIFLLLGVAVALLAPVTRLYAAYRETSCQVVEGLHDVTDKSESFKENNQSRSIPYQVHSPRFTFVYSVDGVQYTCKHHNAFEPDQVCTPTLAAEQEGAVPPPRQAPVARPTELLGWLFTIPQSLNGPSVQAMLDHYKAGKSYTCWYDPQAPQYAVLMRRVEWFHIVTAFVLFLGIACFTGDLYRPGSPKPQPGASPAPDPPPDQVGDGALGLTFGIFLIVNGLVGIFVYLVWFLWAIGDRPYVMTLFLLPFVLLALLFVVSLPYSVFKTFRRRIKPSAR